MIALSLTFFQSTTIPNDVCGCGASCRTMIPTIRKPRWRRRRLKAFHHLYDLLDGVSHKTCYYCKKKPANTMDHFPSLLTVDSLGVKYFQRRRIPFVLVPDCGECNTNIEGGVFRDGLIVDINLRSVTKRQRAAQRSWLQKNAMTSSKRRSAS
jgi:hypothetical protein